MTEETKTEVKVAEVKPTPKSSREVALEHALRDAIVIVEDQTVRLQRMGVRILSAGDWVEMAKGLVK